MKIPTTALILRLMLQKPISRMQWVALIILIIGVTNVQLQYEPPQSKENSSNQSPLLGFITVLTMCLTSAFAGKLH